MPKSSQLTQLKFSYKEVAEALVRQAKLHDGIWGILIQFGIKGANIGTTDEPGDDIQPAAIVPVMQVGLQRFDKENNLSVDAARVNPRPKRKPRSRKTIGSGSAKKAK